jgi:uncharacterized protein (TIGR03067 family)
MNTTVIFAALALGAPALKDPPKKEPTIVGEWAVESVSVGGKPASPASDRWVFNADGTYLISCGQRSYPGTFSHDPKGSPGQLDLTLTDMGQQKNLCRFQIDGDKLVLSVGHDSKIRPAGLEPGEGATVWVMTRIKK